MKIYLLGLCVLVLFSCQQENEPSLETVKETIKSIVVDETLAYMDKDYEKWASFWDHGKEVLRLDIADTGFSQTRGWDKNGAHLETFFKDHPEPISSTFVNSNYLIFCDTKLAWAAFDQKWTSKSGEESIAKATVTLIKKEGSWKIISYTAIQYDLEEGNVDTLNRE